jgi:ElaA protein
MSARTFHDILRLRVDTFVVEQGCAYAELDGRDVRETTEHLWIEADGEPVCYLRTYPDGAGATWVGRVATARAHRRRGLGAHLMRHALARTNGPVRIAAQAHLAAWYQAMGFARCGPDYVEDGISHTPMCLDGRTGATGTD